MICMYRAINTKYFVQSIMFIVVMGAMRLLILFYLLHCYIVSHNLCVRTNFDLDPKQDWVSAQQAQTINL